MSIRKTTNPHPHGLTAEQIDHIRNSSTIPSELRHEWTRSRLENAGADAEALIILSKLNRIKVEAYLSHLELLDARGEVTELEQLRKDLALAHRKIQAIEARSEILLDAKDREIEQRIAAPALAVHSGDG